MSATNIRTEYLDRVTLGPNPSGSLAMCGHVWLNFLSFYDAWEPLFSQLTPEELRMVTMDNYVRIFGQFNKNICAWEAKQKPIR